MGDERNRRAGRPKAAMEPTRDGDDVPEGVISTERSRMFHAKPGMLKLPGTIEEGRSAAPEGAEEPRSAKASWNKALKPASQERALGPAQVISLTDTAVSAMPSSSRDLHVLYEKDGAFAQQLRILATKMEELRARLGYKSFLVTSTGEGQGKTVTASNLALVMSEDSARKIALVDANFRNPRAAELFNLDPDRGLLSVIDGKHPLAQCVARVIGRNLIVLHAGGGHKNPASVLSSPKFKTLLSELYQSVDFLIVDAPPAVPYADVPLLAQHVDAIFLVTAPGSTKRSALDKTVEVLGRNRIAGTVFVSRKPARNKAS